MVHVLGNDDKGQDGLWRSYRFMPPFMQFAFDVRFRNFDHALTLLPTLNRSPDEKTFWEKILKQKPKNLGQAICEGLVSQDTFPPLTTEPSAEQEAWAFEFEALADHLFQKISWRWRESPLNLTIKSQN